MTEYGIGPELRARRLAVEARARGDSVSAAYHTMSAKLAANREAHHLKDLVVLVVAAPQKKG